MKPVHIIDAIRPPVGRGTCLLHWLIKITSELDLQRDMLDHMQIAETIRTIP